MIEIKDLLLNLDNILAKEEIKKVLVCEVLNKSINTSLTPKDVKIKGGTLFLNLKPIYKNEIYFKKDQIVSRLKETLGNKSPENFK